jgi:hypothetical protein
MQRGPSYRAVSPVSLIAQVFDSSISIRQGWLAALYVLHQVKDMGGRLHADLGGILSVRCEHPCAVSRALKPV